MKHDPLFWLYADNYRTYNLDVAKKLNSIHAAILLSELASRQRYHQERNELTSDPTHGEGWFYYTKELLEERTCLTRKNQDTSIEILENHGLIEKKVLGIPSKRHFRLDPNIVNGFFFDAGQPSLSETDNLDCPKRTTCDVRNGQPGPRKHTYKEPKEEPKKDSLSLSHSKPSQPNESHECVSFFVSEIQKKDPKFKLASKKTEQDWARELLAMNKEDGRTWDEIKELISYSQADSFWASRVNTPKNLRKHATTILVKIKSQPIQSKAELEAATQKSLEDRIYKNKLYAELKAGKFKEITIHDYYCQFKIKNEHFPLGYAEHRFKEIFDRFIKEKLQ